MSGLRALVLEGNALTPAGVQQLTALQRLTYLAVSSSALPHDAASLPQHPALRNFPGLAMTRLIATEVNVFQRLFGTLAPSSCC